MSQPVHDPISKTTDENSRIEIKNTTCYMCACRCGIRVTLRDGDIRYIQGNPEHPLNKGVICAKGASGIMKQYSPARLTKPLMRKPGSDRGDNDFEEISWEKAFSVMEERLANIRATDPKEIRAVYWPRPNAGINRLVLQTIRHAQLCRAWRFMFGEHGCGYDLYHWWLFLGVWRARFRAFQAVHYDWNRRRPPF